MKISTKILQSLSLQQGKRYQSKYKKQFNEKKIKTTHGEIRVLEFGFQSKQVQPLFINLHGGGFVLQSADIDIPTNIELSDKAGIKIISIDYPKAPQYPYPIALEAIYEVIQLYQELSDIYRLDISNIGIGGQSAGANLAIALAMRSRHLKDLKFKYQILCYPPLDLSTKPELKDSPKGSVNPKLAQMFNESYSRKDKDKLKTPEISPIYATRQDLEKLPDTLIIAAGNDSLYNEDIELYYKLIVADVKVKLYDFTESIHGFIQFGKSDAKEAIDVISDFIKPYKKSEN